MGNSGQGKLLVSPMIPNATYQLEFLQKIQLLLEESSFSSTYKFALLLALSDLSVEKGDIESQQLTIVVKDVAKKFISYYWRQSSPYPVYEGAQDVLFQNSTSQAAVINKLMRAQETTHNRLSEALQDDALINGVASVIVEMPLWRLQTFSHSVEEFLYPHNNDNKVITLHEGVAYCFRVFHGQIQSMIKGAWVHWISKLKRNHEILGHHKELSDFMFGSERSDLSIYKPILKEIQSNTCFYCGKPLQANSSAVDHYIPWSKYPVDLGHNFVLTHSTCNNDKSDMLAGIAHLENWMNRNFNYSSQLDLYFKEQHIPYDLSTSLSITHWAYEKTEMISGHVWLSKKKQTELLSTVWRKCFE